MPKLTLMEEVLLLGLKDKQVSSTPPTPSLPSPCPLLALAPGRDHRGRLAHAHPAADVQLQLGRTFHPALPHPRTRQSLAFPITPSLDPPFSTSPLLPVPLTRVCPSRALSFHAPRTRASLAHSLPFFSQGYLVRPPLLELSS